jgi:hypothetical protein
MQYFYVTYKTSVGENGYREGGVLSALTLKQAEKRARKAQALYARPGWEEFCECDGLKEISIVDYLVLKKYTFNIDRYLDEDGELIA